MQQEFEIKHGNDKEYKIDNIKNCAVYTRKSAIGQ